MPESLKPGSRPTPGTPEATKVVEHFFRHETGRLHGALTRLLGPGNLSLVEDVAQAALLRAMRSWSIGGIPPNPSAWITQTAMNLARDHLRHRRMAHEKEPKIIAHFELTIPGNQSPDDPDADIRDNALRLMFVCCHPALQPDAQVVLALKVLCGFNTAEIARAFLRSEAAVEKQLTRTKKRIRESNIGFEIPHGPDLAMRLDGVLATLYLFFNEGYKASAGDRLLREDLCREAIRLTSLLVSNANGDTPRGHALLALMLLTAARFPSRTDDTGDLLRLHDQDRSKWNQELISAGLSELGRAASGDDLSEYHLQAGIAACHCTAADYASTDWSRVLSHYDTLHEIKPSPIIALNRAVVVANLQGPNAGLNAVAAISQSHRLKSHYLYHAVLGELNWRLGNSREAAERFRQALALARVGPEQLYLTRMLEESVVSHGHS